MEYYIDIPIFYGFHHNNNTIVQLNGFTGSIDFYNWNASGMSDELQKRACVAIFKLKLKPQ